MLHAFSVISCKDRTFTGLVLVL